MKKCSTSFTTRLTQIKTELRNYFQISDCEKSKSLTTYHIHSHILLMEGCNLFAGQLSNIYQNKKTYLPSHSVISILHTYSTEIVTDARNDVCTALQCVFFITTKDWNQTKGTWIEWWTNYSRSILVLLHSHNKRMRGPFIYCSGIILNNTVKWKILLLGRIKRWGESMHTHISAYKSIKHHWKHT